MDCETRRRRNKSDHRWYYYLFAGSFLLKQVSHLFTSKLQTGMLWFESNFFVFAVTNSSLYRMSLNMNLRRLRYKPPFKSFIIITTISLHQTYTLLQHLMFRNTMILTKTNSPLHHLVSPVRFEEPFRISTCVILLSLITTFQTLQTKGYLTDHYLLFHFGNN